MKKELVWERDVWCKKGIGGGGVVWYKKVIVVVVTALGGVSKKNMESGG